MKVDPAPPHPFLRLPGVLLLAAGLMLLAGQGSPEETAPGSKAFDPAKSPLVVVPPERYEGDDLAPAEILGDSTSFDLDRTVPTAADPFWHDLDVEDGYLFAATGLGLDVYDVMIPGDPQLVSRASAPELAPFWEDLGETFYLESVDAPDGDASLVATAARGQGLIVWDVHDKSAPVVHYQDAGPAGLFAPQVHTAILGGQTYAFVPATGKALLHYNLTAAAAYSGCLESTQEDDLHCPGVFGGITFRTSGASWVHGVENFLAFNNFSTGVVILDVTDPANSKIRVAGQLPGPGEQVAMWSDTSGNLYLGAVGESSLWIYNVTCIRAGSCPLAPPITTVNVPDLSGEEPTLAAVGGQRFLSFSRSGPTPFLYVGNDNADSFCVAQREYLFDMTDPLTPRDVTPQADPGGYWGWYYDACFTGSEGGPGFNNTRPRRGKFYGSRFYRAGFSFLDSHRYLARLAADFTWSPETPLTGQEIQFIDTSAGDPDSWSWDFPDGDAVDSLEQNPTWTFDTAGPKVVTLTVADASGSSSVTKTVTVVETPPGPDSDFVYVPEVPEVGQAVTFTSKLAGSQGYFWHWRFENADKQYLSGTQRVHRTARVTFLRPGLNAVQLWVAGPTGVGYTKKLIKVVPLEPVIEEVMASSASAQQCSQVTFSAKVTGRLPLTFEWTDPLDSNVVATNAAAFAWDVPDVPRSFISTHLTVSNAFGTATAESPPVLIVALGPLEITELGGAPVIEKQNGPSVTFRINTRNAQEWRWTYGDGSPTFWTSDATFGENPTHYYPDPAGGQYQAMVEARNCVEGPIASLPVTIDVAPLGPLEIVVFKSVCQLGFCYFATNQEIAFKHEITGFPKTYQYDWDGDLTFDEESSEPILTHAYTRAGIYRPRLRVIRPDAYVDADDMNSQMIIVK